MLKFTEILREDNQGVFLTEAMAGKNLHLE